MKKSKILSLTILHFILVIYSFSGVISKMTANVSFLSNKFIVLYLVLLGALGVYAIGWQQIIKMLPLTVAYANKSITVVWGMVWGMVFFQEKMTCGKVIGAAIVIIGVIINILNDNKGGK